MEEAGSDNSQAEARKMAEKLLMEQDPRQYLGDKGSLRWFNNARGYQLAAYLWPATTAKPRGVVHLFHGHGGYLVFEYCKQAAPGIPPVYAGSWIETLNRQGFSVAGLDNQGSGRSQGLSGYIERLDDYVDDAVDLAQWSSGWGVPGFSDHLPHFLLGESLGGCVAVLTALRRPELFAGVVLLAPMLSLEKLSKKGLNPYLRPIASWVSWLVPTLPVAATNRNEVHPHLQRSYDLDPYTYKGKTRARNACEYLLATEALGRNLEQVSFPFIVFHSEADTQCDVAGAKQLFLRAKSEVKKLRLVTGMWHMLVKEKGNEHILIEVVEWLNCRIKQTA